MGEVIRLAQEDESCPTELIEVFTRAMANIGGTFEQKEARALTLGNALIRTWLEDELQRMAGRHGEVVNVDGKDYRRHDSGARRYHTLCGPVTVARPSYRLVGVHNGPTVVPLELEAGIIENATPALAFSVTQAFAERPLRHYQVEMAAAYRHTPSRSTLERIGKRTGGSIVSIVVAAEPEIRAAEPVVEGVWGISFGLDRTTVPMAEVLANALLRERRIRRPPPPIEVAYRMAYVATVSVHDRDGEAIKTWRFAATAAEGPSVLITRVTAELAHLRAVHPDAPISVIQDGAPELWKLAHEVGDRLGIRFDAELVDRFHVDERLAQICEALLGATYGGCLLREGWRLALDRSDTAIDRIIRRLDELLDHACTGATDGVPVPRFWRRKHIRRLSEEACRVVSGHLDYLRHQRSRIRYARSRRLGWPIGSGPTEGACKSVVALRCKRSGQRWFESGLAPCLALRALHLSERLRPCFAKLQATRFASFRAA